MTKWTDAKLKKEAIRECKDSYEGNKLMKRYNSLFNKNDTLDDAVQKYVDDKIGKDDLIFYLEYNGFDLNDVDWDLIEQAKKEKRYA